MPSLFCPLLMLVVVLFPNTGISQSDSLPISDSILADTQRYQAQIQDFESEFGPMDNRLLEPLAGLINILVEQRQFERVAEIQSRQLSILRANSGFENLDLLPVLRSMIQVQQALGNWEASSDHLEHIQFLIAANFGQKSEELLISMDN